MTAAEQPPSAPPPPPPPPPSGSGEPVELTLEYPEHIANWRPLVHWLLVIPQMVISVLLAYAAMILSAVAFFTVLFTRNVPVGVHNFMVMTLRYSWRVSTYSSFMRESYPPFEFATVAVADDPAIEPDPATLGIERPAELNRWLPLVKWLLAIPHFFYAIVVGMLSIALLIAAWFAVLFTGRYPRSIFDLLVGIQWWGARLSAYLFFLRDEYPSFRLGR
jgi:hypothetical protein